MAQNVSLQTGIQSPIRLAVPSTAVDVPADLQPYLQPIYSSLYTLVDALTRYAGITSFGEAEGKLLTVPGQVHPQNDSRLWVQASEALDPGMMVNLHLSSGVLKARQADYSSQSTAAHGCYNGDLHINVGEFCEIFVGTGLITRIGGIIEGQRYFLNVNGLIATGGSAVSTLSQYIGFGLGSNLLFMQIGPPYFNDTSGISTGVTYVTGR